MIPTQQRVTNFENGDCFSACIASILELPLQIIPNFNIPSREHFAENVKNWCERQSFILLDITLENPGLIKDCWSIANGQSPRGTEDWHKHSVVWYGNEMAYDPHPDGTGLVGKPEIYTIFIGKMEK